MTTALQILAAWLALGGIGTVAFSVIRGIQKRRDRQEYVRVVRMMRGR